MILPIPLGRRLAAEAVGTAVLALALIGSGIQAAELSRDTGVQLLANTLASVCALGVLIVLLAPVSGAHLNPLVTAGAWWTGRDRPGALTGRQAAGYAVAQLTGGVAGSVLAGLMFGTGTIGTARTPRTGPGVWTGELVATAVLVLLVFGLGRAGQARYAPVAVAAWIAAGIWGTPSGSFANPALTLARAVNDSFTGIAPGSVPGYLLGQLAGAVLGLLLLRALFGPEPVPAP